VRENKNRFACKSNQISKLSALDRIDHLIRSNAELSSVAMKMTASVV
jgi:hypothetical protein